MENIFNNRIDAVRSLMRSKGWGAVVITGSDPHNSEYVAPRWKQIAWLTGFNGEGELVITLESAAVWTDSRYFIQAERELLNTGVMLQRKRVPKAITIGEWLNLQPFMGGETRIAIDGASHNSIDVEEIRLCTGAQIVDAADLLDEFWNDRPIVPKSPIIMLGDEFTGESISNKIEWIRSYLADNGVDAILISALDEIAWLLNIRGGDIDYNPVVISYLLISGNCADWYVKKGIYGKNDGETLDTFAELRSNGVNIGNYDDVALGVSCLAEENAVTRLMVDERSLNYHLLSLIRNSFDSGKLKLVKGRSPIALRKAIKNEVEISGMREAHIDDGLAMERFLFWLENSVRNSIITEWEAAEKLNSLRSEIPGYRGNSFGTISAYGENAALPHYVTPKEDAPAIGQRGLYLCDSGGQYISGTTDITRTVPVGECSLLEKEDYTLVLKGHIALAMSVFPKGTAGCQIDSLAREPLWRWKRNFGHGTGHGVGCFLNVHEGPQDIRQNFNSQALMPGMITSDEPGIYREGRYGIRHENLLLCKEAGSNDFGEWLEFEPLTLCHFDTSIIIKSLLNEDEINYLNDYNAKVFKILSPRLSSGIASWLKEKTRPI